MMGLEPTTFCMASRRSSQLSYIRASGEYTRRKSPARGEIPKPPPRDRPGRVGEADRCLDPRRGYALSLLSRLPPPEIS